MTALLYRLGIGLMRMFLSIHALFNQKSALAVSGRKNLFTNLEEALKNNNKTVVWFHCASLGEFEQGRPLIEYFSAHHDFFILLTFFSPSGFEVRKNYEQADYVTYMPFDTQSNASRFVAIVQPKFAFFIKYEFWYYHLKALENANCWTYSVATILRSDQTYFKWYGVFNRKILKKIDHFFVQNSTTAALLKSININNIKVSGDTRFDRVLSIAGKAEEVEVCKDFCRHNKVLIGGSTWEADVQVIAPFLQANKDWKALIAPHDISEANLKTHENILNLKTERFSNIHTKAATETQVIIIDNIGMLTSLYHYGTVAFIGGAFGAGLHNTLEAACFGLPIFFGDKHYQKFQEANELLEIKAAQTVSNAAAFNQKLSADIDHLLLHARGEESKNYVLKNAGAIDKIIQHIEPIITKLNAER